MYFSVLSLIRFELLASRKGGGCVFVCLFYLKPPILVLFVVADTRIDPWFKRCDVPGSGLFIVHKATNFIYVVGFFIRKDCMY